MVIDVYVRLIQRGALTIEDVPTEVRQEVADKLAADGQ